MTLQARITALAQAIGADVKTLLARPVIVVDPTPTASSTNAVQSGGVKSALDAKANAVRPVTNKTADYTILASESGTIFTNTGATAQINFTLPTTDLSQCKQNSRSCRERRTRFRLFRARAQVWGMSGRIRRTEWLAEQTLIVI
jgi:hypothetical protein